MNVFQMNQEEMSLNLNLFDAILVASNDLDESIQGVLLKDTVSGEYYMFASDDSYRTIYVVNEYYQVERIDCSHLEPWEIQDENVADWITERYQLGYTDFVEIR